MWFGPLLLSLLLLGAPSSDVPRALPALVQITFPGSTPDETHICTGFLVKEGVALTAAHCVPESGSLQVDGLPSAVIRQDPMLAAVVVQGKHPLLKLAHDASLGDAVTSYGYGYGHMQVFRRHVSSYDEDSVILDGPLAPGMSGGPILDRDGKVIGLNQMSNNVMSLGTRVEALVAFMRGVR